MRIAADWRLLFLLFALACGALELYGYERFGVPGTLSDCLRSAGHKYPLLLWLWGFGTCLLIEHLFRAD